MKKFYDTATRTETHSESKTTIISTDEKVAHFFEPLQDGFRLEYTNDNLPIIVEIPKPTNADLLAGIKKEKENEINTACNNAIVSGFYSSVLGIKHFYYSTIAEQSTLNSLVALGVDNGFKAQKVVVVDDDETLEKRIVHNHTHEQLKGVLADGAIHIGTQVAKKDELEIAIENATTVDEVNAIQW